MEIDFLKDSLLDEIN